MRTTTGLGLDKMVSCKFTLFQPCSSQWHWQCHQHTAHAEMPWLQAVSHRAGERLRSRARPHACARVHASPLPPLLLLSLRGCCCCRTPTSDFSVPREVGTAGLSGVAGGAAACFEFSRASCAAHGTSKRHSGSRPPSAVHYQRLSSHHSPPSSPSEWQGHRLWWPGRSAPAAAWTPLRTSRTTACCSAVLRGDCWASGTDSVTPLCQRSFLRVATKTTVSRWGDF